MSSKGSVYLEIYGSSIHDASNKRSFYSDTCGSYKEEQSEFSYDQSELYLSIYNEDLEKQCSEESDGVQLAEVFPRPSSSHIDIPYDLEQFWAYTQSYQQISPLDEYYEVVYIYHHAHMYISPIQSSIEEACDRTC